MVEKKKKTEAKQAWIIKWYGGKGKKKQVAEETTRAYNTM